MKRLRVAIESAAQARQTSEDGGGVRKRETIYGGRVQLWDRARPREREREGERGREAMMSAHNRD